MCRRTRNGRVFVWWGAVLFAPALASVLSGTVQHVLLGGDGGRSIGWFYRVVLVEAVPMSTLVVCTAACYPLCRVVLGLVEASVQSRK